MRHRTLYHEAMSFELLVQPDLDAPRAAEVPVVRELATMLQKAIAAPEIAASLAAIPEIGGSSHEVDAILDPLIRGLGFESQRKGLFAQSLVGLRPDWYRPLSGSGGAGILLEIERGKTLSNNMDILDLWKCHICREAHHLFLIVPFQVERNYAKEIVYSRVLMRMKTFVEPANKVDVATISVFGY